MDRISQLPDSVVDAILCSMPIQDAVRTCVLARAWRYKWATLTKLIFSDTFWRDIEKDGEVELYRLVNIVTTILLQHIGGLHELRLWIPGAMRKKSVVLSPIIQSVLRKGVKKLSLQKCPVRLPTCLYSCTQLTHLELERDPVSVFPQTSFGTLPNLVSLKLTTWFGPSSLNEEDASKIMDLISRCPKIKRILVSCIRTRENFQIHAPTLKYLSVLGCFPCICFLETENVKALNLQMTTVVDFCLAEKCRMMNFFSCLTKLENLTLGSHILQLLVSRGVPTKLPRLLGRLKVLYLNQVDVWNSNELVGMLCLLGSSPKLSKLSIYFHVYYYDGVARGDFKSYIDMYRDHKFENLHNVQVITEGYDAEIKVIEFLLACSPNLEMMSVHITISEEKSEEEVVNIIMNLTRASPKAKLKFEFCN